MKRTEIPPISIEDREELTKNVLAAGFLLTYRAFENKVGTESVLEELRSHLRNGGYAFAANMKNIFKIEGEDIHSIGIVSALGNLFWGLNAKEIEHTDDKIIYVCTDCIWQNAPVGICMMQHIWIGYYVEAINSDYEVKLTQMMSKGDTICSWIIQEKKK